MLGQSSNLRPNLGAQSLPTRLFEGPSPTAGSCHVYRPAPLRGRSPFDGKKVLLIDEKQATREVRENVLRSHGVEVDAAETLQRARVLWRPRHYDLILLDMRQPFPGEALQFYEQIRDVSPRQHFAFLVGPPVYLTCNWPAEIAVEFASRGQ
jgi:CheY-like chemotaxis protein